MGLLPDIADGVGVDIPSAGHVISAYALGVVVGAPVIAALAARLPRRALLVGLMAAFLVGNALIGARARLPHPARRPLPQRPAARRLLRRRLAGRRLAGRPAPARPGGQLGDARSGRRDARRRARRDLAGPAPRLALGVLGRRRHRRDHRAAVLAVVPSSPGPAARRPCAASSARCAVRRCSSRCSSASSASAACSPSTATSRRWSPRSPGCPAARCPLVLLAYGAGGVVGTALGGRLADWALFRSLGRRPGRARRCCSPRGADLALGAGACSSASSLVSVARLGRWRSACRCGSWRPPATRRCSVPRSTTRR